MKKCNKCGLVKQRNEFYKHSRMKDGLTTQCSACISVYNKRKYKEHRERNINRSKAWKESNPERYKKWRRANYRKRYDTDILYKLEKKLRKRLWQSFKNKNWRKDNTFVQCIGCSLDELKNHIESQFEEGMNWENYGIDSWHIDHIIPLSSANTEKDLFELQHYSNLQPLWARDNLKKYNKV